MSCTLQGECWTWLAIGCGSYQVVMASQSPPPACPDLQQVFTPQPARQGGEGGGQVLFLCRVMMRTPVWWSGPWPGLERNPVGDTLGTSRTERTLLGTLIPIYGTTLTIWASYR